MISKFFLVLLACTVTVSSFSKPKLRSTALLFRFKDGNSWTKWSKPDSTNVLIVIDLDNDKIKIYSSEIQTYEIVNQRIDAIGRDTYSVFDCVNHKALECIIRITDHPTLPGSILTIQFPKVI